MFLLVAQTKATAKVIGEWISDRVVGSSMCPPVTIWQRPQSVGLADRPAAPVLIKRIVAARPVVNLAQPRFLIPGKWPGDDSNAHRGTRPGVQLLLSGGCRHRAGVLPGSGHGRGVGDGVPRGQGHGSVARSPRRLRGRSRPCHVVGLPRLAGRQVAGRPVPAYLLVAGVAFRSGSPARGCCSGQGFAYRSGPRAGHRTAPVAGRGGRGPGGGRRGAGAGTGSGDAGVSFGVHAARALEEGTIDGFWANAMGAEVAVRSGIGSVVLDPRRGLGPPAAKDFTFAALVTTGRLIEDSPAAVEAAVRAVVEAQRALRADPSQAVAVGQRLFPPDEAGLIEDLVRRDTPCYAAEISPTSVTSLNEFSTSSHGMSACSPGT